MVFIVAACQVCHHACVAAGGGGRVDEGDCGRGEEADRIITGGRRPRPAQLRADEADGSHLEEPRHS